ncbi:MAG TPA: hypothetical protein ENG63_06980 [Candidatus Desulfofervidus auxilii]|uniref:Uncharacterized protein n=1 Tax=Desulfofervidus auxilii TaxID=1621989 RepID=A0A7C0U2Y3_DESA2|nr:hypothetical protein [Candidatus Desulfofervidus auxilii]
MRCKWRRVFPFSGIDVYIYLAGTGIPAKVYDAEEGGNVYSTPPQLKTDENGVVEFWVDTVDYDVDQLFDIFFVYGGTIYYLLEREQVFDVKSFVHPSPKAFADGDTTPSVKGYTKFITNNSSATTITYFDDPEPNKEIEIIFGDDNTTIKHDPTRIYLAGGYDFTPQTNDILKLRYDATNNRWIEIGRFLI